MCYNKSISQGEGNAIQTELLSELPFWDRLEQAERQELLSACYEQSYRAGEPVYSPAGGCIGMILVLGGILRTFLTSEDGKRATLFRLRQGELCVLSMSCVLSAVQFDLDIEAEEDCRALIIPTSCFHRLREQNIFLENFAYRVITERFSCVINAMQQLMFKTLEQRVIAFLLEEAACRETDLIKMTKEQVAENIGSAREAVSRALGRLAKQALIRVSRGELLLLDREALQNLL